MGADVLISNKQTVNQSLPERGKIITSQPLMEWPLQRIIHFSTSMSQTHSQRLCSCNIPRNTLFENVGCQRLTPVTPGLGTMQGQDSGSGCKLELCSITGGQGSVENVRSVFGVEEVEITEEDQQSDAVEAIRGWENDGHVARCVTVDMDKRYFQSRLFWGVKWGVCKKEENERKFPSFSLSISV